MWPKIAPLCGFSAAEWEINATQSKFSEWSSRIMTTICPAASGLLIVKLNIIFLKGRL